MQTIAAFQAKSHFSNLLDQVEQGEQFVVTKHGHPVAKLIPISGSTYELAKDAIERLKNFSKGNKLAGIDWKSLRDEGRR